MRTAFARYDEKTRTPVSSDEDSCFFSEADLLNSRSSAESRYRRRIAKKGNSKIDSLRSVRASARNSDHGHCLPCLERARTKLLAENLGESTRYYHRPSSLQHFPNNYGHRRKHEAQVTFATERSSSGVEDLSGKSIAKLRRRGKSTPRIIRAIRRSSKKSVPDEDRSVSPRPGNSKSSVVVLYHEKSVEPGAPSPPEPPPLAAAVQSGRDIPRPSSPSAGLRHSARSSCQHRNRPCPAESPEDGSPPHPIDRRKATLRRRRRLSKRQRSLNVHIYRDSRVVARVASFGSEDHRVPWKEESQAAVHRIPDPAGYTVESAKNLIRSKVGGEPSAGRDDDSANPDRDWESREQWKHGGAFGERCRPSDSTAPKLMARCSPGRVQESDCKRHGNETVWPNLAHLMQRMHAGPRERGDDRAFISVNDGDDDAKRVFPFQATPSGNLKIVPNQVVFESKKVSVLVADPRRTKVNVKAELSKAGNEASKAELAARPRPFDLPRGVSSSTINHLQAQKKLPAAGAECNGAAMHSFKARLNQAETMEQNRQPAASSSCDGPLLQEVPLSTLGFTCEQPIDWDNVILPEKTDLYQELARRITNYKNADCVVRIDQDEFHCHLLVLQSYSSFFDEKNCKEIDLTGSDVSSRAFSIIYDWMISTQNESYRLLQRDNILEIFTAAQHLGIKELEEQCWAFIDNDELFTEDTAFLLYLQAKKVRNTAVMELMVPRIMKFFLLLVSTKDFLELSVDELCLLLKSNYISVNSEMEVLMSAVRWLMHDWTDRKRYMLDVLNCIRFGLIAPWQLVDVKRNPENPEFMELMSYPEVQKMVDDGLAFVIIKYWYGDQTEDYYHWIDLLGLTEPTNRNWAGEDKNYVTYREFLLYLDEYQKTKISELRKARGDRPRTGAIDSPHNDYAFAAPRTVGNFVQSSGDTCAGVVAHAETQAQPRQSKAVPANYLPAEISDGTALPTKFMNEYLNNLERSKGVAQRDERTAVFDARFTGAGESARISCKPLGVETKRTQQERCVKNSPHADKLDYESRREKSPPSDVCRCQQQRESNFIFSTRRQRPRCRMPRQPEERTESGKSAEEEEEEEEEEAATTIQAVYRGYKARRRLDEIKKSSEAEKRNVKKVAELLAIRMDQPLSSNPSGEPVGISTSSVNETRDGKNETPGPVTPRKRSRERSMHRNQGNQRCPGDRMNQADPRPLCYAIEEQRGRQEIQRNAPGQRDALKSIRTIESPKFFANCDGKTSSPSDNTDTDGPFSPRTDAKSTLTDFNDDGVAISNEKNDGTNHPDGDNVQRVKPGTRGVQLRSARCKRPLPQRISSSMIGSNVDGYFLDSSLLFPDRESILIFGGVDPHEEYGRLGNTGKDIYRFKPDENVWEFVGEMPRARHHHSVAYLRGRVYIAGGADPMEDKLRRKSIVVGSVWSYDPTTRTWFNEPGMLTARKDFGLVVSHGKMYAIGGQGRDGIALKTVEAFDPKDSTWREVQAMQTARVGPATVKYRDLIWVAGGMTKSKKEIFSKDVECYDPVKNLWLKAVPLRSPSCFATFYVVADCLYLIGGASTTENATQSVDSIDVWDGSDCVWKEHANMSIARHGHSTGSIGDQLLIIGGVTTVFMKTLNSVECFCCDLGKWMKGVCALPHPVCGHGTVSLPPANLLINH